MGMLVRTLDMILRARGISKVAITGVATDLAVEATARCAHDLDYGVTVLSNCCAAATDADHENALAFLSKIAVVINAEDLDN
jgi:nicotinamidase-related amidase